MADGGAPNYVERQRAFGDISPPVHSVPVAKVLAGSAEHPARHMPLGRVARTTTGAAQQDP